DARDRIRLAPRLRDREGNLRRDPRPSRRDPQSIAAARLGRNPRAAAPRMVARGDSVDGGHRTHRAAPARDLRRHSRRAGIVFLEDARSARPHHAVRTQDLRCRADVGVDAAVGHRRDRARRGAEADKNADGRGHHLHPRSRPPALRAHGARLRHASSNRAGARNALASARAAHRPPLPIPRRLSRALQRRTLTPRALRAFFGTLRRRLPAVAGLRATRTTRTGRSGRADDPETTTAAAVGNGRTSRTSQDVIGVLESPKSPKLGGLEASSTPRTTWTTTPPPPATRAWSKRCCCFSANISAIRRRSRTR